MPGSIPAGAAPAVPTWVSPQYWPDQGGMSADVGRCRPVGDR